MRSTAPSDVRARGKSTLCANACTHFPAQSRPPPQNGSAGGSSLEQKRERACRQRSEPRVTAYRHEPRPVITAHDLFVPATPYTR